MPARWQRATRSTSITPRPAADEESITLRIGTSMAEAEKALTLAAFRHYGSHKERTAAAPGISLKTLYNRLKEYGD